MTHLRLPCIRDATTSTLIAILTVDRLRAKEKEPRAAQLPAQLPAHILRSSARSGRSEYQKMRRRRERRCGEAEAPRRGSFGDLLIRFRASAGLTQEELAERAKLSVRGVRSVSYTHLRA